MLKRVGALLGGALVILFSLGWMIQWAMMGIWLLPIVLFLAYFFKLDPKWSPLRFNFTFGLSAVLTWIWALLITRVGPAVAPVVQRLLHSPARDPVEDIAADGMVFPDFIGFITAVGIMFLLVSIVIPLAANSSKQEGRRMFYLGALSTASLAGVVVMLSRLGFTGTAILCGLFGGVFAIGSFLLDPKALMVGMANETDRVE